MTDVVRSLVGLMVRTGAPEPDIGSVEAFKSVLRQAKAISYSKGPSGLYVAELLQRLGLAAEMENKTVFAIGRPVGEVIARGEAEIGMQQIIEVGPMSGKSNVVFWLERHGIAPSDELVERIYQRAKNSDRMLTDAEITECVKAEPGVQSSLAS